MTTPAATPIDRLLRGKDVAALLGDTSRSSSHEGKQAAIIAARQESDAALARASDDTLESLDDMIAKSLKTVAHIADPPESADDESDVWGLKASGRQQVTAVRHSEIRRSLEGLDPLESEALYFSAGCETQRALEDATARLRRVNGAPSFERWIGQDAVVRRRMGAATQASPEAVTALLTLQGMRRSVAGLGESLRRNLGAAVTDFDAPIQMTQPKPGRCGRARVPPCPAIVWDTSRR